MLQNKVYRISCFIYLFVLFYFISKYTLCTFIAIFQSLPVFYFVFNLFLSSYCAPVKTLVISKYGASGDYPGCTDLAYAKAIEDGVDILDCPVQISNDGIPFCMSSINLIDSTNAAQSQFSDLMTSVPEIKGGTGIYAFNLTWTQIQDLTRKFNTNIIC